MNLLYELIVTHVLTKTYLEVDAVRANAKTLINCSLYQRTRNGL